MFRGGRHTVPLPDPRPPHARFGFDAAGNRSGVRAALACPYSMTSPGGVQSHVSGLARALRARGVEVEVIAPADGPVEAGVRVVGRSVGIRDNGSVVPVALSPAAVGRAVAAATSGRFDVIHLHEPVIPAVSLAILATAPGPFVGTFHRYAAGLGWYRVFGPLCRAAVARLDVRVAVSEPARRHVEAVCPGDYEIVPNGIDAGPEPAPQPASGGPGRIVFVGRAEPRKGLPVLLEAFARLPGRPILDLVGVMPEELDALGAGSGVARERIRAHGRVGDRRRDALLRGADVLCAPALGGESFGIVLAEAMAGGVPVVASRVGGFPELVGPDAGLLVPPGDPAATAAALQRMLSQPALREAAARAARARARALDWSVVAGRLLELYRLARERRGGHPRGRAG